MLKNQVTQALNEQIALEAYAANAYLAMAAWCCVNSFHGASKYFYEQSTEERGHMMKLFDYISQSGSHAAIAEVSAPMKDFASLEAVFEEAISIEGKTSDSINVLMNTCLDEKDYSTSSFLNYFLENQHEEDHFFKSILAMLKRVGGDATGLMLVDQEIGKSKPE